MLALISAANMQMLQSEVYEDIDSLTSVIFVVNMHGTNCHYTVTIQKRPEDAPYQYAFRDDDQRTIEFFSKFRLDILALGFVQGINIENEYGNRKQVTFTRGRND